MLHAARWKYRTQKSPKNRHLGAIAQFCRAISSQLRHISTIGKKLLSSNISSRCLHNMLNFGPLAAEIVSLVWGTPAINFNGIRVLAALLHGTPVLGVSQTAALNRGRHLYSAGRPSRWALAHILVHVGTDRTADKRCSGADTRLTPRLRLSIFVTVMTTPMTQILTSCAHLLLSLSLALCVCVCTRSD